jgi:toxin ParE1/3/4
MAHRLAPQVVFELDEIWFLATHPYLGRLRLDLRPDLRSFPAGQYVVFYRIDGDDVLILYVIHGRRDIEQIIRRD